MLGDPRARRAYILTKVGVFAAASLASWPLSRVIGSKAWWGLGAFGAILLVVTIGVFAASRPDPDAEDATDPEDGEPESDIDPDQPVALPIEDSIDLHPFSPRDVPKVVADFLEEAHRQGFREVRLIHGRGIGVQREAVRKVLANSRLVEEFRDAPAGRGGWGATVAQLRDEF
jgi:hypothetical protein